MLRRVGEYAASRVVRFKGDGGFPLRDPQGSRNEVKCHGNASAEMSFNLGK